MVGPKITLSGQIRQFDFSCAGFGSISFPIIENPGIQDFTT
jgi:hypothetical protein